jgi:3-oxoacyl-[acyl-carrier-protein] synthase-1
MTRKRVVITGAGIVSCIGNDLATVEASLREGRSGIQAVPKFTELGLRSQVAGVPQIDLEARIDRKQLRFMGDAAAYAQIALEDAIKQAGLTPEQVSHPRTGLIMGSGGGSPANQIEAADTLREKGIRRVGPYQVTRCMSSTVSACLATNFKVKGINYSITSACSTSAHCIGAAAQQIAWGMQDVMFAGGGAVVLESLEHAQARGATILAEVVGFGATSDGEDMVAPSGDGAIACMQQALEGIEGGVDYINTHGTSTPVGDMQEVRAMKALFGDAVPPFSSTKSLTGHSLGATGVQEAIYCLIMLRQGFIAGSVNVETPDPLLGDMPLVTQTRDAQLNTVLSNSFGFGGTNASLVLRRFS